MIQTILAKDIMSRHYSMAYEGWSIDRLIQFLARNNISGAPVIASDHSLVGVVAMADVIRFLGQSEQYKSELLSQVYSESIGVDYDQGLLDQLKQHAKVFCTVNQIMSTNVMKADVDTPLNELAGLMVGNDVRRLFITQSGIIVGMVSTHHILQAIAESS